MIINWGCSQAQRSDQPHQRRCASVYLKYRKKLFPGQCATSIICPFRISQCIACNISPTWHSVWDIEQTDRCYLHIYDTVYCPSNFSIYCPKYDWLMAYISPTFSILRMCSNRSHRLSFRTESLSIQAPDAHGRKTDSDHNSVKSTSEIFSRI